MFHTGIALFAFLHNVIDCVVFTFAIRDDFARKLISCFFGRAERTRGKLVCILCAPSDTHTHTHILAVLQRNRGLVKRHARYHSRYPIIKAQRSGVSGVENPLIRAALCAAARPCRDNDRGG